METSLYKITFKDGRVFKVFCANKAQKKRFRNTINQSKKPICFDVTDVENGIHDINQWEEIIKTIN